MKTTRPRIHLITLGNELLLGLRENSHLTYLGDQLTRHGLILNCNTVIEDEPETILSCFAQAWESADLVITTGGLGPTSDDNTREAVAAALEEPLEYDPAAEAAILDRFARINRKMTDRDRKQCFKPRGATLLPNPHGTAPGIWYEQGGKRLIMLPGPTHELRPMLENEVLPRLQDVGWITGGNAYLQLRVYGLGESLVEDRIQSALAPHPGIGLAFCAHHGLIDVRISRGETGLDPDALYAVAKQCRELLGEDFVCCGDSSLAKIVCEQLRSMEKTLAVAESCTGGLLANAFTDIPGASKVFLGGVVCYNNDAKVQMVDVPECILQQHGAVSAETAVAMVTGAAERFGADYALSVTGFAGPGGGTIDHPVGTVFLGYHSPCGDWSRRVSFAGERVAVKQRAVNTALDWMRRKLNRYKVEDMLATL